MVYATLLHRAWIQGHNQLYTFYCSRIECLDFVISLFHFINIFILYAVSNESWEYCGLNVNLLPFNVVSVLKHFYLIFMCSSYSPRIKSNHSHILIKDKFQIQLYCLLQVNSIIENVVRCVYVDCWYFKRHINESEHENKFRNIQVF